MVLGAGVWDGERWLHVEVQGKKSTMAIVIGYKKESASDTREYSIAR